MKIDKHALIRRQVAAIGNLSLDGLRIKFEELYGFPSKVVNAETFRRRIAYRLPEFQKSNLGSLAVTSFQGG